MIQIDLLDYSSKQRLSSLAPLADRVRPRHLNEFVGQEHILSPGKLLYRVIKADRLTSLIFYGPPGVGKTALAQIIANTTKADFQQLNAVMSGVSDIRKIIKTAKDNLAFQGRRTILFIDEIHRFNKSQQDALLPFVEDGTIIFIGATTENPMFEVISPLLSRSRTFQFYPLEPEHLKLILNRAINDKEKGLGDMNLYVHPPALEHIIQIADGDVRAALNTLELAAISTPTNEDGLIEITVDIAAECSQRKVLLYDKTGDTHYDTISAYIKSLRGSDPDAALYWLARMIYAGEDPRFIARRLLVHAAEDVGLADPRALQIAQAAAYAVDFLGLPEGRLPLAEATIYIATAPKSNSVLKAIDGALDAVKNKSAPPVPPHLRNTTSTKGIKYKNPHHYPGTYVDQDYLPSTVSQLAFYHPTGEGYERNIQERLLKKRGQ
jgi:putative ATPase